MTKYEYKQTENNIPFKEIAALGEEGWLPALEITETEQILWAREKQEDESTNP